MAIGDWEFSWFAEVAASMHYREASLARVGASAIAGCCESAPLPDQSLATWAQAYGDQTEQDHARLVKAIKTGKVKVIQGV